MPEASETFDRAKTLFFEGVSSFEAGCFEDADRLFVSSLTLLPGRVSTLVNLAATRLQLSRPEEALDAADQALRAEPDDVDAWFHRASALGQLGRHEEALLGYGRVLDLDPGNAGAWSSRGGILRETQRLEEAAHDFEQALLHGGDAELNGYYLAAVRDAATPASAPALYVQPLFDDYASQYDEHMVAVLNYRAHTVLVENLDGLVRGRFASALDLGCGTGLCGPLVKPLAERLAGVDLSSRMIEKAQSLGVYERLLQADIVEYLRSTSERYDLVLAADVFIYVGDLAPVFEGVRRVIDGAGVFCFSAELASDEARDFELLPSLRYAHSERYFRELAARHGFEIVKVLRQSIREDQRRPVAGMFVYATITPRA